MPAFLVCFLQAKADGIEGNFSGDLLQSGGMLIVAKGTVYSHMGEDVSAGR